MGKKKSHDTQLRGFDDAEVDKLTEGIANLMGSEEKQWLEKLREMHPNALVAFCAGSAPKNGGEGGTAAYAVYFPLENDPMVSSPVTGKVTNYRADCEAAKEATTTIADKYDLERERELVVYSLCQNLVNAMADSPRWIDKWQRNGWKNSNKKPVEHQDIFKALLEAETHRTISWRFVDATNGPEWCYKLHEDTKKYASRVAYSAAKEDYNTMRWLEYSSEDGYEYTETRCFYAVAIGRRTGVFTRLEEANQQVFGFPGFRMRKFNNYEDARDFLEEFEIYCDSLTEEGEEEEEEEEDEQEDDDIWFYAVAEGRSTGVFLAVEDARDQIFGFPGARMDAFLEYDDAVKYIERTIAIIREEKKRKEEEEKRRQVWFYAVAVGRSTGVFMDYQDAMEQIRGYSDFRMEKFLDFDEAQEYVAFNQVYSSDEESEEEEETWFYAVAVGRRVGIYTNHEAAKEQVLGYSGFRMKKFEDYEAAKEYMHNNQTFEEDEEKCEEAEEPAQQVEEETWYYAVAVGRIVGIYAYSENAIAQVHGYPGFRMRKFQHFADAQAYIESFQVCYSEEEEKNEEQEAEAEEVGTTWFYAVAVGRSIGIYTTYEEAIKQVHGYSGFRMKKFLDYDEAEDYLDFNRVYSSDGDEWANGSEDEIEPEEEEEIWHYAVAVGRRIGVYTDLEVAKAQVHRYSGFLMKKFLDYDEAAAYVEINKSENWGNNELPEEDEDEKWYYAVAVGRRTGVYSDREVAVDQVHGYSGFRMKKFLDYSEAHAYIKNNRAHHRGSIWGYNGVWA